MIFLIILIIPFRVIFPLGTEIFVDLAQQMSNSTNNGTKNFPYSNLGEAVQLENAAGNNISGDVFVLIKNEANYPFFDELTINFSLIIRPEINRYVLLKIRLFLKNNIVFFYY